jgi:hypothetical protein
MSLHIFSRTLLKPSTFTPLSSISRLTITRKMATSAPEKFEWLVVMPDQPDALARRLEVRP